MIEVKAPNNYNDYLKQGTPSLFLAGSIEMGTAEKWQEKVVAAFRGRPILILNPRRDDWDSNWEQSIDNPEFAKQVNWELDALDNADLVIFYFDPNTKSPITLLELGLQAQRKRTDQLLVICPEGYWRRGNVQIVCQRKGIAMENTLEDAINKIKQL